jgi:transaldolase
MVDINEAIQAGADIVTIPPKFFPQMCSHPKTDEAVAQFMRDFREWSEGSEPTLSMAAPSEAAAMPVGRA